MNRKRIIGIVIMICMLICITSCALFTRNTYRSLTVVGYSYQVADKMGKKLIEEGLITAEQENSLKIYERKFQIAYHAAVDALAAYKRTNDSDAKKQLQVALDELVVFFTAYQNYIKILQ